MVQLEEIVRPLSWLVTILLRAEAELENVLTFPVNVDMLLLYSLVAESRLVS